MLSYVTLCYLFPWLDAGFPFISPGVKMAKLSGPAPNPNHVRRHKDTLTPGMEISYDGVKRGPDLPEEFDWCSRTREWWDVWRLSPQAQLMTETDWHAMLEAALFHNDIWSNLGNLKPGDLVQMSKRMHDILANYGMTYADRLKLRIKIVDDSSSDAGEPSVDVPDNVLSLYRSRLSA
jgi:hypothetical protein